MSTPFVFGEEPCGYTYKAENHAATIEFVLDVFNDKGHTPVDSANAYRTLGFSPDWMMRQLAQTVGIEYDDPRSYDTDEFPKPIYGEQLSCSDLDWAPDLAPDHYWVPWMAPHKDQECGVCGISRAQKEGL